jgi:hypothetical protein
MVTGSQHQCLSVATVLGFADPHSGGRQAIEKEKKRNEID